MELNVQKIKSNNNILNELGYFQLLYSNEIIELLAQESSNYYKNILLEKYGSDYIKIILETTDSYPYLFVTKGITKEDILGYIGIRIYMGLFKLPSIRDYWKDGNILYETKMNKIMTSKFFDLLGTILKEKKDNEISEASNFKVDPRHKVNLYFEKLNENFQTNYELGQNITIDESLIQFKGRNSMKFYIP